MSAKRFDQIIGKAARAEMRNIDEFNAKLLGVVPRRDRRALLDARVAAYHRLHLALGEQRMRLADEANLDLEVAE